MVHSLLRGGAVAAALAATIGLASTLTACASSTTTSANAGSAGDITGAATTPAPSASSSPSPTKPVNPGGPVQTPSSTAQAQTATLPSGAKYVGIQRESQSTDGRTLYLVAEAQGGACGNFTVVLQESATAVHIGLAKMPVKTNVVCPMYITARTFQAKLASPVGNRAVIDLATNAPVGP
jgi:hypothetical protein